MSTLDALGYVHFPFAGEQRHYAHLSQVDAHGIVGLFKSVWGQVELANLHFLLKPLFEGRGRWLGLTLKHVNAPRADGGEQVVQVLWGLDVVRNPVIHLVVREMAFFSSGINEFRNV